MEAPLALRQLSSMLLLLLLALQRETMLAMQGVVPLPLLRAPQLETRLALQGLSLLGLLRALQLEAPVTPQRRLSPLLDLSLDK